MGKKGNFKISFFFGRYGTQKLATCYVRLPKHHILQIHYHIVQYIVIIEL